MASAILFAGVLAVISAIMSGQKKAFEAEQQVMATLAAEELMGQIITEDYDFIEPTWGGLKPAGDFAAFVSFDYGNQDLAGLGVVVSGTSVHMEIHPSMTDPRVLVELDHFIPAPQP